MANPGQSLGGLLGGVDTSQLPGDTTSQSNQSSAVSQAPASLFAPAGTAAAAADLSGGSSNFDPSTIFDPTLFGGQGVFSPTQTDTGNLPPSTPAIAQAQQDPSGQIIDQQQPARTSTEGVDRTGKGDLGGGDTATPQTDQGQGDQTTPQGQQRQQQQQPQPQAGQQQPQPQPDPRAPLQPPQSPLQRLLASQRPAASTPAAPAPAPAAPAQPPSLGGGGRGTPAAAPAPPPGAGGPPPLLRAIMSLLGVPMGGQNALQQVARQAYPQRPGLPMAPTGGLGPYGRAIARRRAFGGPDQGRDDTNYSGTMRVPPPGSTSEVSAPTSEQVRASRMAGTDTPPTEGFSSYLQTERARFGDELRDPKTKWETLAMIGLEHGQDPAAVAESLLNRANYAKTSISNMLHSGFYGPINRGQLAREIRMLQRNPEYAAKLNAGLETAMRGSNLLGGATDQGSGRDPNVGHSGGRIIRYGETYNDWGGGPGGHDGAAAYRRAQQQRVRQEQQEGKRGESLAMDIGRVRSALPVGGAEVGPMRMPRGGTSGKEFRNIEEQRRKRTEEANALS